MSRDKKSRDHEQGLKKELTSTTKKRTYIRPSIYTEDLMAFGALCNGTTTGGRKTTVGAPEFCNSSRLMS